MDEHDPRDDRRASRREPTTPVEDLFVVKALTARVVELEEIVRILTCEDGDGHVRLAYDRTPRLDTILSDERYLLVRRLHRRLTEGGGS